MRRAILAALAASVLAAAPALAQEAATTPAPQVRESAPTPDEAQIRAIFAEVREMLDEAAEARRKAQEGEGGLLSGLIGTSHEDRADRLLSEAFEVIADAPIVDIQREIAAARARIDEAGQEIVRLREERLTAPEEQDLWGSLTGPRDRSSVDEAIAARRDTIASEEARIGEAKTRFRDALAAIGTEITPEQADILLDGVTGSDIVGLAAAYDVVRGIGRQLMEVMEQSGEELGAARRYYAMHTTLIALLVHAQEGFVAKVEQTYLPRLDDIETEIAETRAETRRLLEDDPTPAQRTVLDANLASQDVATEAAGIYRDYLTRQRDEVAEAHRRTVKELRVADNTLRTVDASFRLREIMESATLEFETLQSLESPGFEAVFQNRELREKFEELSGRLRAPSS